MKAFKALAKPLKAPQKSVKIKIEVHFVSSHGIGTGRDLECVLKNNCSGFPD